MSTMSSRPRRRGLAALLTALLTTTVASTGLAVVAAPAAHAVPETSCTFTEYDDNGYHLADFASDAPVWLITWVDGRDVWSELTFEDFRLGLYAELLAIRKGRESIDYRAYPRHLNLSSITYDTPALCEASYRAPRAQTITFAPLSSMLVDDPAQELAATSTSGLQVTFSTDTPLVCQVTNIEYGRGASAGSQVTARAPGTCRVQADQTGGALGGVTYGPAPQLSHTFAVKAPQTISFAVPQDMPLDGSLQQLDARSSSRLQLSITSETPAVCTIIDNAHGFRASDYVPQVAALAPGSCTLRADQPGGRIGGIEYLPATRVTRTFRVLVPIVTQTITFAALEPLTVGGTQGLAARASSELPVGYVTTTPDICRVTGGAPSPGATSVLRPTVSALAPGTCSVTATQAGGDGDGAQFLPAEPLTRTFPVTAPAVEQPVTPPAPAPTEAAPPAAAVAPAAQTVTVAGATGIALSSKKAPVVFTSSARLPVQVTSRTPSVCTPQGGEVRLHRAGTCTLTGEAAGDAGHLAAPAVTASFEVWAAPALPAQVAAPRVVDVLGRGEEALRVAAGPADVCLTVPGGRVIVTDAGTCTVRVTTRGGDLVRSDRIRAERVRAAAPDTRHLSLAGSVRFGYLSAQLTDRARTTLRHLAPRLRDAQLVTVYGNTQAYGAGDTPANRELSASRAAAVVAFLRSRGVDAKATTVALASRNPVGANEAANRRADIYWVK